MVHNEQKTKQFQSTLTQNSFIDTYIFHNVQEYNPAFAKILSPIIYKLPEENLACYISNEMFFHKLFNEIGFKMISGILLELEA